MLSTAITVLFTFTGVFALIAIAYALRDARAVYAVLVREGDLLRAELAEQSAGRAISLRRAPQPARRSVVAMPRPAIAHLLAHPAYAAA